MQARLLGVLSVAAAMFASSIPAANASSILVGQCLNDAPCDLGTKPHVTWSDTLDLAQLRSLGLGKDVSLVAFQTNIVSVQLGVTEMVFGFGTPTGSVTESLPEFTGTEHNPCASICGIQTVGAFAIPSNATSAMISGTFGNSTTDSSAPVNLYLQSAAVPLPASAWLLVTGMLGLLALSKRTRATV
jgi:hypothetical protein